MALGQPAPQLSVSENPAELFDEIPLPSAPSQPTGAAAAEMAPDSPTIIYRAVFGMRDGIGSFWYATNGLLQGDPLSVVILNCVLCSLINRLSTMEDLSVYAFADALTVVSTSWDTLICLPTLRSVSLVPLRTSVLTLVNDNFGIKVIHMDITHPISINLPFVFTHFCSVHRLMLVFPMTLIFSKMDDSVLLRARRIAKLPLPFVVSYRLFKSLVSSCYNHYALSCDIMSSSRILRLSTPLPLF